MQPVSTRGFMLRGTTCIDECLHDWGCLRRHRAESLTGCSSAYACHMEAVLHTKWYAMKGPSG